jgi:hypothetical protein
VPTIERDDFNDPHCPTCGATRNADDDDFSVTGDELDRCLDRAERAERDRDSAVAGWGEAERQRQGAVEALREAWLGERSGRRYALHGPTHNCAPEDCQIGQCPAIRTLLGGR